MAEFWNQCLAAECLQPCYSNVRLSDSCLKWGEKSIFFIAVTSWRRLLNHCSVPAAWILLIGHPQPNPSKESEDIWCGPPCMTGEAQVKNENLDIWIQHLYHWTKPRVYLIPLISTFLFPELRRNYETQLWLELWKPLTMWTCEQFSNISIIFFLLQGLDYRVHKCHFNKKCSGTRICNISQHIQ